MKPLPLARVFCNSLTWAAVLIVGGMCLAQPPTPPPALSVSIFTPTNSQTFAAPATIEIGAAVKSSLEAVTVQYFAGASSIGTVTNWGFLNPSFYISWANVPAGNYSLTAVATDYNGNTATSAPVNVTVTNVPLTVSLEYPTSGAVFNAPANIGINSRVSDSLAVETVQYFSGTNSLGTVTNLSSGNSSASFYLSWSNVAAGSYTITAVAADSGGVRATSAPVNITVTNIALSVHFVYPTNYQSYAAPASIGMNVAVSDSLTVKTVQYFAGTTSLGSVTNLSSPGGYVSFYFVWTNVAAGTYALTAVATDSGGAKATSTPVNITVTNVPLSVHFVYPTNNQTYIAPATIGLSAAATDSLTVETVQYFAGTNSLGTVTYNIHSSESFYLSWSNVAAGTYTLTAVATDSGGAKATSAPVNITVTNIVPSVHFVYPTNNQIFAAPASIGMNVGVYDSLPVKTVQYFAGTTSLGTVSNLSSPGGYVSFYFVWTNVAAGTYTLTAVATDSGSAMVTSAPVNITVTNIPLAVHFVYPSNNQTYTAPATIGLNASVTDSVAVLTVQYFAGTNSLGIVANNLRSSESFYLSWSNVAAGTYTLTAVATDSGGAKATSAPVNITVTNIALSVHFVSPTNNQTYTAPASIGMNVAVYDSLAVKTVQYFAGTTSLGSVTNLSSPGGSVSFYFVWTNVAAGTYTLTAVATDSGQNIATSAPVNITVTNIPLAISLVSPTNGTTFGAPASFGISSRVTGSTGVTTVQYFSGTNSLGSVSNNPSINSYFYLLVTNLAAGRYTLTAVATASGGVMATSAPVNVTVTNIPLSISMWYPTNTEVFVAPADVGVHARVADSQVILAVQYFAGTNAIGTVINTNSVVATNLNSSNPFFLNWSNVLAGTYTLTAIATDAGGISATSAPVTIVVVSSLPPTVSIYAPAPVAIAGTNGGLPPIPPFTNSYNGTNTATFLVQRTGSTSGNLIVFYSIGGTASNGVDYTTIASTVAIAAGQTYALITIIPLPPSTAQPGTYKTVILTLTPSPAANPLPSYNIGLPSAAEAIILEDVLPVLRPTLHVMPDNTINLSAPATDGMPYCVQISTDLVNWVSVCTNTAVNGSVQFADPNGASAPSQFYRIVPVATPANY